VSSALGTSGTAVRDQDAHGAVCQAQVQADRRTLRGVEHGVGHQLAHDELRRVDLFSLDIPGRESVGDEGPRCVWRSQRGSELE
jgi:hypothetical protein